MHTREDVVKPLDPSTVPAHKRFMAGTTGLVHGPAPFVPRTYARAVPYGERKNRKGRKARARMERILIKRFGTNTVRLTF